MPKVGIKFDNDNDIVEMMTECGKRCRYFHTAIVVIIVISFQVIIIIIS